MQMEKTECKNGSVLGVLYVQIHGKYKEKTKQKPPEVEEARDGKTAQPGEMAPPRPWGSPRLDRGCHHGPWWSPRAGRGAHCGGCPVLLLRCVLVSFGASPWAAGFCLSWGILGLFLLLSFDPHGPNFFSLDSSQTFLPKSTA